MQTIARFLALAIIAVKALAEPIAPENICNGSISLVYSPAYRLCLPQDFYRDAAITAAGDLLVKFADGSYFFGKIISADMDGLPETFDMRLYPEYLYGIRDLRNSPQPERFRNSTSILQQRYGNLKPKKSESNGVTIYFVNGNQEAEAYIVLDSKKETVLLLGFSHIDTQKIGTILKGFQ